MCNKSEIMTESQRLGDFYMDTKDELLDDKQKQPETEATNDEIKPEDAEKVSGGFHIC